MVRTSMIVGESVFLLAQGQDRKALERRIAKALDDGGRFVEFVVVGNRTVSTLIAGSPSITFLVETVPFDDRDTADVDHPFGGFHDSVTSSAAIRGSSHVPSESTHPSSSVSSVRSPRRLSSASTVDLPAPDIPVIKTCATGETLANGTRLPTQHRSQAASILFAVPSVFGSGSTRLEEAQELRRETGVVLRAGVGGADCPEGFRVHRQAELAEVGRYRLA